MLTIIIAALGITVAFAADVDEPLYFWDNGGSFYSCYLCADGVHYGAYGGFDGISDKTFIQNSRDAMLYCRGIVAFSNSSYPDIHVGFYVCDLEEYVWLNDAVTIPATEMAGDIESVTKASAVQRSATYYEIAVNTSIFPEGAHPVMLVCEKGGSVYQLGSRTAQYQNASTQYNKECFVTYILSSGSNYAPITPGKINRFDIDGDGEAGSYDAVYMLKNLLNSAAYPVETKAFFDLQAIRMSPRGNMILTLTDGTEANVGKAQNVFYNDKGEIYARYSNGLCLPVAFGDPIPDESESDIAHVILILGQSNAVGSTLHCILNPAANTNPPPVDWNTYSRLMNCVDSNIKMIYFAEAGGAEGVAYQTNVNIGQTVTDGPDDFFEPVHLGMSYSTDHFGPEVGIAESLSQLHPGEKYYIIKAAKGGVFINESWLNNQYCWKKMQGLWDAALQSFAIDGLTPQVDAIVWLQGESEGTGSTTANNYLTYQSDLAARLRSYFADYAAPGGIRFVDSGISDYWGYYTTINNAKQTFANSSSLNYFFNPQAHGYTYNCDPDSLPSNPINQAHWDAKYVLELGKELGKLCY